MLNSQLAITKADPVAAWLFWSWAGLFHLSVLPDGLHLAQKGCTTRYASCQIAFQPNTPPWEPLINNLPLRPKTRKLKVQSHLIFSLRHCPCFQNEKRLSLKNNSAYVILQNTICFFSEDKRALSFNLPGHGFTGLLFLQLNAVVFFIK